MTMNMDRDAVERAVRSMLEGVGEDPDREGLKDTPRRVAKAWEEMLSGYGVNPSEILQTQFTPEHYDEMIICRDISFHSTCEHHLLPFSGIAHVGYIPSTKLVGLSKMPRLVDCYARRLQIQERMTSQIADAMESVLSPKGVAVVVTAHHLCMSCRGVKKQTASMVTSAMRGAFTDHKTREEFLSLCLRPS